MNRETMLELRDSLQTCAGAVNLRIDSGPDEMLTAGLVELTKALAENLGLHVVPRARMRAIDLGTERNNLRALIESFPTLQRGTDPELLPRGQYPHDFSWDPGPFAERWKVGSGGEIDAALFVLSVWNSHEDWAEWGLTRGGARGGFFNLHAAMSNWDEQHRAAFLAWAANPWWL